ncbi:MAG: 4Fe-4S binding protein [Coriobacteriales bacterium]
MSRFSSILGLWDRLSSADIAVEQHRCVVVRNRNARCRLCAQACTTGCISTDKGQLVLDAEKCVGCGTCATVCPAEALRPLAPSDDELFKACNAAQEKTGGRAVIACERAVEAMRGQVDPEKLVGVTCLGRVDESLVMRLVDAGARSVRLVCCNCQECELATGRETAEAVLQTVSKLLDIWGQPVPVKVAPSFPVCVKLDSAAGFDPQRRGFFSSLKQQMRQTAYAAAAPQDEAGGGTSDKVVRVNGDGALPRYLPQRRRVVLELLRKWGLPEDEAVPTRLWGQVSIDTQRCRSCRMCAVFCPTGALSKHDAEDGSFGVVHAPSLCVKCRTCQSICPAAALSISDHVRSQHLVEGFVEYTRMEEPSYEKGGPHSATNAMRYILGSEAIYER